MTKTIFIDNNQLINNGGKCYNPGLVEKQGKLYLVYRYEPVFGHYTTEIGLVELDKATFEPIAGTNRKVKTFRYNPQVCTIDDPRAFLHKNEFHAVVAHGKLSRNKDRGEFWDSSIVVTAFNEKGEVQSQRLPEYGNNINASNNDQFVHGSEKNWSPFIKNGEVMLVYTLNPTVVIQMGNKDRKDAEVSRVEYPTDAFKHWKWGNFFSGGTNLIKVGDEYIGLFHTFLNVNPGKNNVRRYYSGAYAITAEAPFRITKMTRKPILQSVMDDAKDMRPLDGYWRPNVAYPCGILKQDDKILVSYGWQDCRCAIDVWDFDDFMATLEEFPLQEKIKKPKACSLSPT